MTPEQREKLLKGAKPDTWIALSADETKVIGRGETYGDALADAERNGETAPVLIKVPSLFAEPPRLPDWPNISAANARKRERP
jgi:hypothetical protein